ncbi:MAG: hypothetical protein IJA08_03760 [Clostridia bacterium]|nr:hypothetical protein [Clostridia bacterium]
MNKMKNEPYSYHTFLFPFIWNNAGKTDFAEFVTCLDPSFWIEKKGQAVEETQKQEFFEEYQAKQYFIPNARNLLYDSGASGVVHNYDFLPQGKPFTIENGNYDAEYIITKTEQNEDDEVAVTESFRLAVNGIRLRIFNSGVAILKLETEYYGDKTRNGEDVSDQRPCTDDFCKINEFGRRINLPFLGAKRTTDGRFYHALVADCLELRFNHGEKPFSIREDYSCLLEKLDGFADVAAKQVSETFVSKTIKRLIDYGQPKSRVSSKKEAAENAHFIYPIIDDRMFVCAMICDKELSDIIAQKQKNSPETEYLIYEDDTLSKEIYRIGFVETDCTCQNREMRKSILKRCVYGRWLDYGTIDVITHHSLIRITTDVSFVRDAVAYPFLMQYVQMAEIALLQRATVLALIDCTDDIAAEITVSGGTHVYDKIFRLQAQYILAQNQIFLGHVTVQEQGIEEYEMLLSELYIPSTLAEFDAQIKDVYALSDGLVEKETGKAINYLTILSTLFAVSPILIEWPSKLDVWDWLGVLFFALGAILGVKLIISRFFHRKGKKKGKK